MPTDPTARAATLAGQLRAAREALIRQIGDGRLDLSEAVAGEDIAAVKVVVVAQAVPGVGKVRARQVLDGLGIDHNTRWAELGARQAALVDALTAARDDGASRAGAP